MTLQVTQLRLKCHLYKPNGIYEAAGDRLAILKKTLKTPLIAADVSWL